MKPVYRSNVFALCIILGQILGSLFLGRLLYSLFPVQQVLVLSQVLFLIIPTIIYFVITGLPVKETLKLKRITLIDIGLVIAIAFFSQPVASFLSALTNMFFENQVNEVLKQMNSIPYLVQLGVVALTPAICEEITMRGIVLSGYKKITGWKAALMTGLIFGILHLNPQQFLYAFVLGILFAYLVRITDSIFSSMICHFIFNGIQITMAYMVARLAPNLLKDTPDLISMSVMDKVNTLLPLLFSALFFGSIVFLLVRKLDKLNSWKRDTIVETNNNSLNKNEEIGYLLRGNEEAFQERVVNAPFVATVIVSSAFMILIEILSRR